MEASEASIHRGQQVDIRDRAKVAGGEGEVHTLEPDYQGSSSGSIIY
jgi:hypothetical protein